MSTLALPSAGHPTNGEDLDADIVRAQILYLLQQLQSIDLSNAAAGTLGSAAFDPTVSPALFRFYSTPSFIVGGGLPVGFTGLNLTVPALTGAYFQNTGLLLTALSGGAYTVSVSQDTYFSINSNGAINTPQAVSNGAAVPTLASNSQWLFKAISGVANISSIVDLRNLSQVGPSGYAQATSNISTSSTTPIQAGGLSVTLSTPTIAGRRTKIIAKVPQTIQTVTDGEILLSLWDGPVNTGTQIGSDYTVKRTAGSQGMPGMCAIAYVTPATSVKTYNVGVAVGSAGGTGSLVGSAASPIFLEVDTNG